MDVSIITVNYNREHHINNLLTSWYKYPRDFSYEFLIVDNGSSPQKFKELHEKWRHKKEIRWIELCRNWGFGRAHNKAVKLAQGKYLALVNPDVLVFENGIKDLTDFLGEHEDVGIVGAKLVTEKGNLIDNYRRFMRPYDWLVKRIRVLHRFKYFQNRMREYLMWDTDKTKVQTVDWLQGSSMVMRKKDYEEIGGFDDRYFLLMEDMDLCRKMWEKGKKVVFNPKVGWQHAEERMSDKGGLVQDLFNKMSWIHLSSLIKYFFKWGLSVPKVKHEEY